MERDGSKEPVPYNGIGSGPSLPRRVFAPWVVPSALLPQGDSLWLAPSAHVCGRLLGREAGRWPTSWGYYSTPVRILQGGWGITWTDGIVLACAFLQRRVWFGLRRCPTCPPSNVFGYRGTRCTPGGAAPLHPAWGKDGGPLASLARGGRGTLPNLPPSTRAGTEPPTRAGVGMGPLRSAIQRGHSAVIARS